MTGGAEPGLIRRHDLRAALNRAAQKRVLSLAGHSDPERFVAEFSGSDRTVAEYLMAEIAGELSVSLNTVDTHIRRIYAKLGATDRTAAAERARELRLLSVGRTWSRSHRLQRSRRAC